MLCGAKRFLGSAFRRAPIEIYARVRPVMPELAPGGLSAYLDAISQRRHIDGAVIEVGCFRGGTTRIASALLERTGSSKPYVCVDTFGGFVGDQFRQDLQHGTSPSLRRSFAGNSARFFRRLMAHYGCGVEIVEGDICTVGDEQLPATVSVALIDVDLEIPVYHGLTRIYARLVEGGVIFVDDCAPGMGFAGARAGYRRFVAEHRLSERYFRGMGIVTREPNDVSNPNLA